MMRFGWSVLLVTLLAGCSGFGGGKEVVDPPAELPELEPRVELKRVWSRSLGAGTDGQFVRLQIAFLGEEVLAQRGILGGQFFQGPPDILCFYFNFTGTLSIRPQGRGYSQYRHG